MGADRARHAGSHARRTRLSHSPGSLPPATPTPMRSSVWPAATGRLSPVSWRRGPNPTGCCCLQALSDKDLADVHAETPRRRAGPRPRRSGTMRCGCWPISTNAPARICGVTPCSIRAWTARSSPATTARCSSGSTPTASRCSVPIRGHCGRRCCATCATPRTTSPTPARRRCCPADTGDGPHRGIAFVTVCRCLGIPARLNPETRSPQYFDGARFVDVQASGNERLVACTLTAPGRDDTPRYGVDWTIGRLQRTPHDMDFSTIDLGDVPWTGRRGPHPPGAGHVPRHHRHAPAQRQPAGRLADAPGGERGLRHHVGLAPAGAVRPAGASAAGGPAAHRRRRGPTPP